MKYEDDSEQDLEVYRRSWDAFIDAYSKLLEKQDRTKNYEELFTIAQAMAVRLSKSKTKVDQTLIEELNICAQR